MEKMKPTLDSIVKLYRQWATSISSPKDACLFSSSNLSDKKKNDQSTSLHLQSFWNLRDLEKLEQASFVRNHYLQNDISRKFSSIGFPLQIGTESLSSISPSGQFRALIRKSFDLKGTKTFILEIWSRKSKMFALDLTLQDIHGDICEDGQFGALQWSSNEKKIVYIAEKKIPKSEHFLSHKINNEAKSPTNNSPAMQQGIGQYRPEWGEQLVGRYRPQPFVLDVETSKIDSLENIPETLTCGQAIFGPDENSIIFVGWDEGQLKKLGLIFCPMRKNKLCIYSLNEKKFSVMYDVPDWCIRSPKLSPDSKTVIFLENPVGGPHNACARLSKWVFDIAQHSIIIDVVEMPIKNEFPGLYCDKLPQKCFTENRDIIILQSFWNSKQELLAVNLASREIQRLTNDDKIGSWNILDQHQDWIVVSRSALNVIPHLAICRLKLSSQIGKILETEDWFCIDDENEQFLDCIEWEILHLKLPNATEGMHFEAIVSKPTQRDQKLPVIFIPHGGPHSTMSPQFYLSVFLFNKLGFAVVLVNFRGSLGFGQKSLESLLTSVGDQEVQEMVLTAETIAQQDWSDNDKFAIYGGSFGGYLAAQLVGQYPNLFCVCVCRNPVVDINSNVDASDIPDWGWVTAGLGDRYTPTALMNGEVRKIFWDKSPFRYIEEVKADFLMLLSKNDLRVPPFQGINYYNHLKAIGKAKTNLFMYDDNHSQAKVDVESDAFVRSAHWIFEAFYQQTP